DLPSQSVFFFPIELLLLKVRQKQPGTADMYVRPMLPAVFSFYFTFSAINAHFFTLLFSWNRSDNCWTLPAVLFLPGEGLLRTAAADPSRESPLSLHARLPGAGTTVRQCGKSQPSPSPRCAS